MDRVDSDAELGDGGGDAIEPEVHIAAGPVEEQDGGVGAGRCGGFRGFDGVDADCLAGACEGAEREGGLGGDSGRHRRSEMRR